MPAIKNQSKSVTYWIFSCAFLVLAMVFIGGLTRLTGSGLSIVEWRPVTGIIFPLNEAAWAIEFAKYQLSPEFQKINFMISMADFKEIYFLEYFHRMVGRFTVLVFLVPFIYFVIAKKLNQAQKRAFVLILGLFAAQGLMGWLMVKSGLRSDPHVSHIRLALHLILAFFIYSLLFWQGLNGWFKNDQKVKNNLIGVNFLLGVIFLQVIYGAFTAGLKAGLIYNNFPYMGESFIASDIFFNKPLADNFINNPALVQLIHRCLAFLVLFLAIYVVAKVRFVYKLKELNFAGGLLLIVILCQIILGIVTLRLAVPVALGSLHQVMAIALLSVGLMFLNRLCYLSKGSSK